MMGQSRSKGSAPDTDLLPSWWEDEGLDDAGEKRIPRWKSGRLSPSDGTEPLPEPPEDEPPDEAFDGLTQEEVRRLSKVRVKVHIDGTMQDPIIKVQVHPRPLRFNGKKLPWSKCKAMQGLRYIIDYDNSATLSPFAIQNVLLEWLANKQPRDLEYDALERFVDDMMDEIEDEVEKIRRLDYAIHLCREKEI